MMATRTWVGLLLLAACDYTEPLHVPEMWKRCQADPTLCGVGLDAGELDSSSEDAEASDGDATSPDAAPADARVDAGPVCMCTAAQPVCLAEAGACVQCTAENDDACGTAKPVCQLATNTCVACLGNTDCKLTTEPICDQNACRGCTADADCAEQGKVCHEETGECVACTPDQDDPTKESCSNGNACDPKQFTCTGAPRRSLSGCLACTSDSECLTGHRCVSTSFKGGPHGTYCLLQQASGPCPDRYKAKRTSVSALGVSADYCFPNDSFTTCEGVLEFGNLCAVNTATQCGADDLTDDGLCVDGVCTYGCDSDRDCSGTQPNRCTGGAGAQYCRTN